MTGVSAPMTRDFLSAVAGHERPKRLFARLETVHRLPSGFLFHGSRGRGKHTFATHWAHRTVCTAKTEVACGRCPSCKLYVSANHPDCRVVAPNEESPTTISIAEIRDLREWFSLSPSLADRRIAIIDQAEKLSGGTDN